MNQLTLIVVVLVVYMAAMLLIGWLGRSKSDNFDEYVTAAKKGSFLLVCGSYIGIPMPQAPGFGIDIDEELVKKYSISKR